MNSDKAEILTKWYLRFNGYFIVENFIVHAADDQNRIVNNVVLNYTEVDTLAIRHKYSYERTGNLLIENDNNLIVSKKFEIDFIIGETKTGNQDSGNKIWIHKNELAISYLIKFAGFIDNEEKINEITLKLLEDKIYEDKTFKYRIRLIIFSESDLNKNFKNTKNIKLQEIIDFMLNRGECWQNKKIGDRSKHIQWDPLINEIFKISNNHNLTRETKSEQIITLMSESK